MPESSRQESFVVERTLLHERLDNFLRQRYPAVTRSALKRLIEEGHIRVNGQIVKATHAPHLGEEISVRWPEAKPAEAQPEDIPLDVLFEDRTLLVLNKPAGLVVHPGAGHDEHTLVNALLHHCAGELSGIGGVARPGIVHRLDKETSGCLVVAKDNDTHIALSEQFAGRTVGKIYHAIVCGEVAREQGEIRAAIARHSSHRKRMTATDDTGRPAWTSFRVQERLLGATLVEAVIHTGRTHQIRVHLQHIGHPLVGDTTYGPKHNRKFEEQLGFAAPRVMLHASSLSFTHPTTGKKVTFKAPLPADYEAVLKKLR